MTKTMHILYIYLLNYIQRKCTSHCSCNNNLTYDRWEISNQKTCCITENIQLKCVGQFISVDWQTGGFSVEGCTKSLLVSALWVSLICGLLAESARHHGRGHCSTQHRLTASSLVTNEHYMKQQRIFIFVYIFVFFIWMKFWLSWVKRVLHTTQKITGHLGEESFQTIYCTATENHNWVTKLNMHGKLQKKITAADKHSQSIATKTTHVQQLSTN